MHVTPLPTRYPDGQGVFVHHLPHNLSGITFRSTCARKPPQSKDGDTIKGTRPCFAHPKVTMLWLIKTQFHVVPH
jgi:hypothetical protein